MSTGPIAQISREWEGISNAGGFMFRHWGAGLSMLGHDLIDQYRNVLDFNRKTDRKSLFIFFAGIPIASEVLSRGVRYVARAAQMAPKGVNLAYNGAWLIADLGGKAAYLASRDPEMRHTFRESITGLGDAFRAGEAHYDLMHPPELPDQDRGH
jgi:hypothetical protein